jgi:hypothetical protein
MGLCNSEAILSHPRDLGPGGSHGAVGAGVRATSQAEDVQGWRGMGGGGCIQAQGHEPTNILNESPQHLARPLSTRGHTTLPPMWGAPRTSESW